MSVREEQKEMRRNQILMESLDLFVKNGYHGMTTKLLAESLGISTGLLFHYFKSKEELYLELLHMTTRSDDLMSQLYQPELLEHPELLLREMITAILESFRNTEFSAKLFCLVALTRLGNNYPPQIAEFAANLESKSDFEQILRLGQQKGVVIDGDPAQLGSLLYSIISGIAMTSQCFPDIPMPEPEMVVQMFLKKV